MTQPEEVMYLRGECRTRVFVFWITAGFGHVELHFRSYETMTHP